MSASWAQVLGMCKAILAALGDQQGPSYLVGPLAWAIAEGGWSNDPDNFNIWNTTQGMPGSYGTNSDGVQSYPSEAIGVQATVLTLNNGLYPDVLAALASGNPNQLATAVGNSHWGTSGATIAGCIDQAAAIIGTTAPVVDTAAAGPAPGGTPDASTPTSSSSTSTLGTIAAVEQDFASTVGVDLGRLLLYGIFALLGVALVAVGIFRLVSRPPGPGDAS